MLFNQFKEYNKVTLTKANEDQLISMQYNLNDFKNMLIPKGWRIDYATIPSNAYFQNNGLGYEIISSQSAIRFVGNQHMNSMQSSYIFELNVKKISDEETEVSLGIHDYGLKKGGYKSLVSTKIIEEETTIETEIDVFDQHANIAPTITVKGAILLLDFKIYKKDFDNFTVVEGEIKDRSQLPAPENTDYSDCRYTAFFIGNRIISGMPCNKELSLSIDGFEDKKILQTNTIKAGTKIRCGIVPIDSVPDRLASIEEADDLCLFQLENYLLVSCEIVSSFPNILYDKSIDDSIAFRDSKYVSIFDRKINPPLDRELNKKQEEQISLDKNIINKMLQDYSAERKQDINQAFLKSWTENKNKDPSGYNRIKGYVWRNIDGAFYALPESYHELIEDYSLISQFNLDSLIAFRDYLETQGIQLMVSLIPSSLDIAARVINTEFRDIPDFRNANIVKQLLENNIEAIYISNEMIRNYNKYPFAFLYPFDNHPADLAQDISSSLVAERVSRFDFPKEFDKRGFSIKSKYYTYDKNHPDFFIFPTNCDVGDNTPGETYQCNQVFYQDKSVGRSYSDSPVFILSNSFGDTPSGSSFSDYLTMKTLNKFFSYTVTGGAVIITAFQRIFNHPESFLKGKKLLILHIGTNVLQSNIPNFRELDSTKNIESNLQLLTKLEINGNETTIPQFAQKLTNPSIFRIGNSDNNTGGRNQS